jgi:hypothetical protein
MQWLTDIQRPDWIAGLKAGLIAGTAFILLEMGSGCVTNGESPMVRVRMIAALALGPDVLAPPATFHLGIVLVAMLMHYGLSIIYAQGGVALLFRFSAGSSHGIRRSARAAALPDQLSWVHILVPVVCRGPKLDVDVQSHRFRHDPRVRVQGHAGAAHPRSGFGIAIRRRGTVQGNRLPICTNDPGSPHRKSLYDNGVPVGGGLFRIGRSVSALCIHGVWNSRAAVG